jgi:hypothetical protein
VADSSIHPLLQLERNVRWFRRKVQAALDEGRRRVIHVNQEAFSEWDNHKLNSVRARVTELEGRVVDFAVLARRIRKAKRRPESKWGDAFVKYQDKLIDLMSDLWNEIEEGAA